MTKTVNASLLQRFAGALRAFAAPRSGVLIAALAGGLVLALAANLPGHLSYDSVLQLAQGRARLYNGWHPPVMAWMLGLGDALVRGTALFVAFDTLLLYGALALLALLGARKPSWWAPALALVLAATPQWLIYPGIVWKDVLFAGAALAGFALLAAAAALWTRERLRAGLIAGAFLVLCLAALARQNGVVVLPIAAGALGWIAMRMDGIGAWRAGALAVGVLAGCVMAMAAADAALATRGDGEPSRLYQIEDLQTYDLAAAFRAEPGLKLPRLTAANPALDRILRGQGAAAYTPERIDPLTQAPELLAAQSDTRPADLSAAWRSLVVGHPLLYLRIRSVDFAWVFLTPRLQACLPFYVGIDGPGPWMRRLGLAPREDARDRRLQDYGEALARTPVFSHALYAAIAVAGLVVLLRRRRAADIAVAGLIASALVFTASFFVISVACDYRYLYFLDVAAAASALYLAAGWRGVRIRT